jgi:hypothetical protein
MSSGFRSSCYWIDWNWANTENIRIGLVFAYWPNESFLYYIDRFDHIKANKSKLINNVFYYQYLHIRTSSVWCGFLLNLNCMLYSTIFFAEWISNGRCMFYSTIFFAEWRSNGRFTDEI